MKLRITPPRPSQRLRALAGMLASLAAATSVADGQTIRRVDDNSTAANPTGSNWTTDAYKYLEDALAASGSTDQVWVAEGTYIYKSGAQRTTSYVIPSDVLVYGGFDATETSLGDRAGLFDQTILTGDFNQTPTNRSDDAYHVVSLTGTTQNVVLDGFTIEYGNADGTSTDQNKGGGLWVNDTTNMIIANCTFTENYAQFGGGANIELADGLTMKWCTFDDNLATGSAFTYPRGGGLTFGEDGNDMVRDVFIFNTVFKNNQSDRYGGGLAFLTTTGDSMHEHAILQNCLFHDNEAIYGGGLWVLECAEVTVGGCTFAKNHASSSFGDGGGLCAFDPSGSCGGGTSIILSNSIVWTNSTDGSNRSIGGNSSFVQVDYSDIQDGWSGGTGNIAQAPSFTSISTRVFTLEQGSPCVDSGGNSLVPDDLADIDDDGNTSETVPWDIRTNFPRIVNCLDTLPATTTTDMGCYERAVGTGQY